MKEQTKGKNSFPLNPFLFAFCFNKVFWATGIHSFNSPMPFAQNGKNLF